MARSLFLMLINHNLCNRLVFNVLQKCLFCLPKVPVLQSKTGRFADQNNLFCKTFVVKPFCKGAEVALFNLKNNNLNSL